MKPIIEVDSVSKIYNSGENPVKAVDKVSFSVETGEFVALVGPSGSGKTTMLALVAALLYPSDGKIIFDGTDLDTFTERQRVQFRREKIGFAFQSHSLVPYLTVYENVELMLRLNNMKGGTNKIRVKELLESLGLMEKQHVLPNQLSGGQRQRVAVARSVAHHPRVVLADEPTANLDTERAYHAVEIFADLIHGQERCGIMVTHDLRMCRFVDKILQMEDGKLSRIIENHKEIVEFTTAH
jgi:putative ABC transport system ATP-binding protein